MNLHYAYLIGALIILPLWVFLYYWRPDLRFKMLFASFCVGILALIWSPWFWFDYWSPQYLYNLSFHFKKIGGIEDFFYGFFSGGISSVIYEEIFGKKFAKRINREHHWILLLAPLFILFCLSFGIPIYLGLNSLYAALIAFLIGCLFVLYFRKDLIIDALASGLLFSLITLLFYIIFLGLFPNIVANWWHTKNLSGIFILGIPIEELSWAFAMGMMSGPLYEFAMGLRLAKIKR